MQPEPDHRPEGPSGGHGPSLDAGADSSNRPWETDSMRIGQGDLPLVWGWVAAAAAALAAIGDLLALASPAAPGALAMTRWPPLVGHYLGLLATPLFIPGYWLVYRGLRPAGAWSSLPVFLLGAYLAALAGGLRVAAALPAALVGGPGEALAGLRLWVGPLAGLALALLVLVSLWFAVATAGGRSHLPRWLAPAGPLLPALAVLAIVPAMPQLLPLAADLGHLVFFAAVTAALARGAAEP